jgi:hypothetical protein
MANRGLVEPKYSLASVQIFSNYPKIVLMDWLSVVGVSCSHLG